GFWAHALGARSAWSCWNAPQHICGPATCIATVLCAVGLARVFRCRLVLLPATLLFAFVVSAGYFALAGPNPFPGGQGQTWSLFKLSKWAFPTLVAFQAAGLAWLLPRPRIAGALMGGGWVVLVGLAWKENCAICRDEAALVRAVVPTPR